MEPQEPSEQELVRQLKAYRRKILRQRKVEEAQRQALLVPLAELFKMIIPNVHKLDEYIYASRHGMTVEPSLRGADLRDANGGKWELKVSVMNPETGKVSFGWPVPVGKRRRAAMLKSIFNKTEGGGAILRATDKLGRLIKQFTFTHAFLMAYFARAPLTNSGKYNMGCCRCKLHGDFHRLEYIDSAQFDFESCPATVDWDALWEPAVCYLADA